MPQNPKYLPLIEVGPVRSLDAHSAGDYIAKGDGVTASNVNTNRVNNALTTELGRTNLVTLTNFTGYQVTAIVPYANTSQDEQYLLHIANVNSSSSIFYDACVPSQPTTVIAGEAYSFRQGLQFYNTIYTDAGYQWSSLNPNNYYLWQYGAPNGGGFGVTTGAGSLPAGTYYYAFTRVVTLPNGAGVQETSAYGNLPQTGPPPPTSLYPFFATSSGTQSAVITATAFSGTYPDGSTWTTNIYRQSTNVPVWTLLANVPVGASYTDNANDTQIGANAQLVTHDPPPLPATFGTQFQGAIFNHQERIFVFTIFQNSADTANQPESQLWYSDLGTPWSFNQVAQQDGGQVLLVGNSATPSSPSIIGYGDVPVGGISMGGLALLFKSQSCWILFGNDQDTYFTSLAFPIGLLSKKSLINIFGTIYWLSPDGCFSYAGNGPQYLSEKVVNLLNTVPYSDQINAVSMYANQTWYLSFPATQLTLCYYIPTAEWYTLPYSCSAAASIAANPTTPTGSFTTYSGTANEVVAGRPSLNALDNWFTGENDLGAPVTGIWTSPLTCSESPQWQKTYDYITILAPYQAGSVTVTLTIDPGSNPPKVYQNTVATLLPSGQEECRHIFRIKPDLRGYQAQLTVQFTNTVGQLTPITIYSATVWGTLDRELVIPA